MDNAKLIGTSGIKHVCADSGNTIAKDINNLNQESDCTSQWNLDPTLTNKAGSNLSEQRHLTGVQKLRERNCAKYGNESDIRNQK